LPVEAWAN